MRRGYRSKHGDIGYIGDGWDRTYDRVVVAAPPPITSPISISEEGLEGQVGVDQRRDQVCRRA